MKTKLVENLETCMTNLNMFVYRILTVYHNELSTSIKNMVTLKCKENLLS